MMDSLIERRRREGDGRGRVGDGGGAGIIWVWPSHAGARPSSTLPGTIDGLPTESSLEPRLI